MKKDEDEISKRIGGMVFHKKDEDRNFEIDWKKLERFFFCFMMKKET